MGYKSNVYKHFALSDLFVLSSLYEGMPNVMIEAIACGLPVVSTNCKTGPKEILRNGGGVLCDVGDEEGLAKGILAILSDKSYGRTLHEVAKNNIRRYSLEDVSSMYAQHVDAMFSKFPNIS